MVVRQIPPVGLVSDTVESELVERGELADAALSVNRAIELENDTSAIAHLIFGEIERHLTPP